jgi:putative redox protein
MSVIAQIGTKDYAVAIDATGHHLMSDEPTARGGGNLGPSPYDLLLASLAACTGITLRMYATRKQWDLKGVEITARLVQRGSGEREIERTIGLVGTLDEAQRARLLEIAEKTPVTLTIRQGMAIATRLTEAKAGAAE